MQSLVTRYERMVAEDPITEPFSSTVNRLIQATGTKTPASRYRVSVPGIASGYPAREVPQLQRQLRAWQRPILHAALLAIAEGTEGDGASKTGDPITAESMLALMCRGAQQCHARKVAVFMTVLECASNLQGAHHIHPEPTKPSGGGSASTSKATADAGSAASSGAGASHDGAEDPVARARATVLDFLLGKMDEWKEKALASAFTEPSKAYYTGARDGEQAGDADVHGANVSLSLLAGCLGVRCARQPFLGDEAKGCVPWRSSGFATKEVIDAVEAKGNFGKPWTGIRKVREGSRRYVRDLPHRHSFVVAGPSPQSIV